MNFKFPMGTSFQIPTELHCLHTSVIWQEEFSDLNESVGMKRELRKSKLQKIKAALAAKTFNKDLGLNILQVHL